MEPTINSPHFIVRAVHKLHLTELNEPYRNWAQMSHSLLFIMVQTVAVVGNLLINPYERLLLLTGSHM